MSLVIVLSRFCSWGLLLSLLSVASPAAAMSRIVVDSKAPEARLAHVREAHASGPTRTTVWMSAHVEGTPAHVAWIVSIPKDAALDVGATSWLDALESATAPRMLPPASLPPNPACAVPPAPETVTDGDASPVTKPSSVVLATSSLEVTETLAKTHISLAHETVAEIDAALSAGERLVVLVFDPTSPNLWTITLRVVSESPMPLPATTTPSLFDEADRVIWLLGNSRATLPAISELTVDPSQIHWLTTSATDYTQTRAGILSSAPLTSALTEVASERALTSLTILPGNHVVPSAVDAYVERISKRGEATNAPASTVNAIHEALAATDVLGEACPRGDLVPAGFTCIPPAAGSPEAALVGSGVADDLAFALAGAAARTWVTRLAGSAPIAGLPASGSGPQTPVARHTADPWPTFCPHVSPPSAGGVVIVAPSVSDPGDGSGDETADPGLAPADLVQVSGESSGTFSCSSDESSEDDSSCNQSSSDSHDGCSCDNSSSEGSSGCGSSSEPSGGCSGGSAPSDCTIGTSGRGPRRIRIAKYGFLTALGALLLRRRSRPRHGR